MSQYYFRTNEFFYIFGCQLVVSFLNTQPGVVNLLAGTSPFSIILWTFITICGIWNLDFFRYLIPPFCASYQISPLHVITLELEGVGSLSDVCAECLVSVSAAVDKIG